MTDAWFITDFADQAVLLPLAIGAAILFAAAGWRRGAIAWAAAIAGTFVVMFALKLGFLACGHLLPFAALTSPSGHTAAGPAVYGGLAAIAARRITGHGRWAIPCAILVALVIGASRLSLGVHTLPEVALGAVVGVSGALAAASFAGAPPAALRVRWMTGVVVLFVILLHGFHMPAEAAIRSLAVNAWPLSECRK